MIEPQDLEDVRLCRPVSVTDVWDLDNRVDRLQDAVDRLERVVETLIELYRTERIKGWQMILDQMLRETKQRGHQNDNRTFGTKPKAADPERPL